MTKRETELVIKLVTMLRYAHGIESSVRDELVEVGAINGVSARTAKSLVDRGLCEELSLGYASGATGLRFCSQPEFDGAGDRASANDGAGDRASANDGDGSACPADPARE